MKNIRIIVFVGLFVAMDVILERYLGIETLFVRFGLGFIPISLSAAMFGPIVGALTGALADIAGMIIFPKGPYFPGFTVSALLTGAVYGLFLYRRSKNWLNICLSVLIVSLVIDLGLTTIWLSILYNRAVVLFIGERIVKTAIVIPLRIVMIYAVWRYAGRFIESRKLLKET